MALERNFYRYAVETCAFRAPEVLSCAPNRIGSGLGERLFLMNHFVTMGSDMLCRRGHQPT